MYTIDHAHVKMKRTSLAMANKNGNLPHGLHEYVNMMIIKK